MSAKNVLMAAAGAGGVAPSDPNFNQTVLLLHGDGNQGANNLYNPGPTKYLAFSDNSNNNFPITVNGDAYGTTNSPYEASYSNVFEASSGLTVPAQQFPGDFTWELWYYPTALGSGTTPNYSVVIGCGDTAIQNIQVYVQEDGTVSYYNGSTGLINSAAGIVAAGQWYHIALVRSGSTTTLYVNGVSRGSGTDSGTKNIVSIGCFLPLNAKYNVRGYLSNVRTTTTAVYTSAFTPPTAPLTAISGTNLLLCQANRFADNSASPKTVTVTGNVTVSPFQPFTLAANDYGAGYFDGTGDYLTAPNNTAFNLGTNNFTIEGWFYTTSNANQVIISAWNTNSFEIIYFSGVLYCQTNASTPRLTTSSWPLNQWNHIAFVRSGNTYSAYLNGSRFATATDSASVPNINAGPTIGVRQGGTSYPFVGYLSNLRFVNGTAVYDPTQTTLTVPTTPLTNITNTQLLTCQYSGSVRNVGFIDSSPNYFPITRVGNTTQGTFSPFSVGAGQWGNYFIGTSDAISFPDNIAFTLTADFCVECWFYQVSSASGTLFSKWESSAQEIYISTDTSNRIRLGWGSFNQNASTTPLLLTANNAFSLNTWTHLAVVRNGNTFTMYINGVSAATATFSTGASDLGEPLYIGGYASNGFQFPGYISNARIVKGSPVYTAPFTPPTAPLTAITNTVLLTCQDNRFRDKSSNGFVATVRGTPRVTPFSPFAPTAAYDPAVNGGSGYFDGTGDYLAVAPNSALLLANTPYTVEFFVYFNAAPSVTVLLGWQGTTSTTGYPHVLISGGNLYWQTRGGGSNQIIAAWTPQLNTWHHIAVGFNGSNQASMWLNGTRVGTAAGNAATTQNGLNIGGAPDGYNVNGYMSGVRIIRGTDVYGTSNTTITIPTAPLTPVVNTSFLCNFTNAGIFDNTGKNVLETVGNAQVDTNIKKYGTGSMKFDGSGDYLLIPDSPEWQLGGGDFTIEAWINTPDVTPSKAEWIVSQWLSDTQNSWGVRIETTGELRFWYSTAGNTASNIAATTPGISNNTWTHIAVVRNGSTVTIYVDGVSKGSGSVSGVTLHNSTASVVVGGQANTGLGQTFTGFIDDLRITKGVARYTTNFTPPALAFPDK